MASWNQWRKRVQKAAEAAKKARGAALPGAMARTPAAPAAGALRAEIGGMQAEGMSEKAGTRMLEIAGSNRTMGEALPYMLPHEAEKAVARAPNIEAMNRMRESGEEEAPWGRGAPDPPVEDERQEEDAEERVEVGRDHVARKFLRKPEALRDAGVDDDDRADFQRCEGVDERECDGVEAVFPPEVLHGPMFGDGFLLVKTAEQIVSGAFGTP